MSKKAFPPPEDLSERSKGLWKALCPHRGITVGRREILRLMLQELDRADQAKGTYERDGVLSPRQLPAPSVRVGDPRGADAGWRFGQAARAVGQLYAGGAVS